LLTRQREKRQRVGGRQKGVGVKGRTRIGCVKRTRGKKGSGNNRTLGPQHNPPKKKKHTTQKRNHRITYIQTTKRNKIHRGVQ